MPDFAVGVLRQALRTTEAEREKRVQAVTRAKAMIESARREHKTSLVLLDETNTRLSSITEAINIIDPQPQEQPVAV